MEPVNHERLTLLLTSDMHGAITPSHYRDHSPQPMGLAKLSTLIKKERIADPELLLIDNGDLLQGTPLSTYYFSHRAEEVHPMIQSLNHLRYDAAVIGNHEFNYGADMLERAIRSSDFPWLSANTVDRSTNEPAFGNPYLIKRMNGDAKVAILGITTSYIPHWEQPEHIAAYTFPDALETAKYWVARIQQTEKPDVLIVAYHGGFERDIETGRPIERLTGENQGYAICEEVPGIDVLITGHQHRLIAGQCCGVSVIQPGCNAQNLGKVTLHLSKGERDWTVTDRSLKLLSIDDTVEADDSLLRALSSLESETQRWLDKTIGEIIGDMTVPDAFKARVKDNAFIEFINRVQMETTGAALSCTALLSNNSRGFHSTITIRDVRSNFMFPNTLTVLALSGQDIKDALEQTAEYFAIDENGKLFVNPAYLEPKAQHYNYDMWDGIAYVLDISKPVGSRVTLLTHQGAPLEMSGEYHVAMSNYRASGGGNYEMFSGKTIVRSFDTDYADLIAEYIAKRGKITASCDNSWEVVPHA